MPPVYSQTPRLGGGLAVALFITTLFAFVAESQLTQYVQSALKYRQPFFLFYVVHSTFCVIFPLHFLYLTTIHRYPASELWSGLCANITVHLAPPGTTKFPYIPFFQLALACTIGITLPALLWFAAITLASVSDVTAIWNTNAFFAYVIAVKLFRLKWEPRRLLAVLLATLGVTVVVYGGSTSDNGHASLQLGLKYPASFKPSSPLIGDLLTLVASVGYGLYQVLYKKYATLPMNLEIVSEQLYDQISAHDSPLTPSDTPPITNNGPIIKCDIPPFGLHANFLTSCMGLFTFAFLWLPIPILHYLDVEHFMLPPNFRTVLAIAGIASSGVVFNAGFMVLLGIWGPIITSVGNLLTIVLVFISDMMFGTGPESVTMWSVIGCSVIVAAFSVLSFDMFSPNA